MYDWQVGEQVVWDRCHLNVTTIIKNHSAQVHFTGQPYTLHFMFTLPQGFLKLHTTRSHQEKLRLVVLRGEGSMELVSVKAITQYPLMLDDMVIILIIHFLLQHFLSSIFIFSSNFL